MNAELTGTIMRREDLKRFISGGIKVTSGEELTFAGVNAIDTARSC